MIAVDLRGSSDQVIGAALRLATAHTEFMLLHVVCDLEDLLGAYICPKPRPGLQSELAIEGKSQLRRLGQEFFTPRQRPRELVLSGDPWIEIVGAADRHEVDAIFVGAHNETRPESRLIGRTVDRVMRYAPCSVVVVPSE